MKRTDWFPQRTRADQRRVFLLGLATIYDGLVMTLTLGHCITNIRAWLLFEVWGDD